VSPVPAEEHKGWIPSDLSKKNVLLLMLTATNRLFSHYDPIFVKGFVDAGLGAFNLHLNHGLAKRPTDIVGRLLNTRKQVLKSARSI